MIKTIYCIISDENHVVGDENELIDTVNEISAKGRSFRSRGVALRISGGYWERYVVILGRGGEFGVFNIDSIDFESEGKYENIDADIMDFCAEIAAAKSQPIEMAEATIRLATTSLSGELGKLKRFIAGMKDGYVFDAIFDPEGCFRWSTFFYEF